MVQVHMMFCIGFQTQRRTILFNTWIYKFGCKRKTTKFLGIIVYTNYILNKNLEPLALVPTQPSSEMVLEDVQMQEHFGAVRKALQQNPVSPKDQSQDLYTNENLGNYNHLHPIRETLQLYPETLQQQCQVLDNIYK